MRKNKKLLLASVAAMGALALGVGATSTFAWYQATSYSGRAAQAFKQSDAISVTDPGYSAEAVDLPVKVTITREGSGDLELSHWFNNDDAGLVGKTDTDGKPFVAAEDAADGKTVVTAGLYHGYYLRTEASSLVYTNTAKSPLVEYAVYKVQIQVADFPAQEGNPTAVIGTSGGWVDVDPTAGVTIKWQDKNGNQYDAAGIKTKLEGTDVNFRLAATDGAVATRAVFFGLSKPTKEAGVITPASTAGIVESAAGTKITSDQTVALHDFNSVNGTVLYFGLYVEGSKGNDDVFADDVDTGTIKGDFKITVSGSAIA